MVMAAYVIYCIWWSLKLNVDRRNYLIIFFSLGTILCTCELRLTIDSYCDPKRCAVFAAVTVRVFALQHLGIAQGEEPRRGEVAAGQRKL